MMRDTLTLLITAAAIALATPALAQTSTEQPAEDSGAAGTGGDQPATGTTGTVTGERPVTDEELDLGQPVGGEPGVGEPFIREVIGDWSLRCIRSEDGNDPCQLYQLLQDGEGNSVAEISIFPLPEGQQAAAGATIITPLGTLLTQQITLTVDGGGAKRYPFSFCTEVGCIARVGFLAEEVAAFRRGNVANLRIVPAAAPDQTVELAVSLTGFTAAYEAVTASNEASGQN